MRRGEESREGEGVRMWGDRGVFKGGRRLLRRSSPLSP